MKYNYHNSWLLSLTKNYRRFKRSWQKQKGGSKKNPWEYYSWKQKSANTKQAVNNFYKFL